MMKYIPVPEAPYDPDEHVAALWKLLHSLNNIRDARDDHIDQMIALSKKAAEELANNPDRSDHGYDYTDDLSGPFTEQVYSEAAYFHTAATALAALFEGAFRHEFNLMETLNSKEPIARKAGYKRSSLPARAFWNPAKQTDSKGKVKSSPNIVTGALEILEAIELIDAMPSQFSLVVRMLFLYRNNTMHNGYEWGLRRRTNFLGNVENAGGTDWFEISTISGEPWTITMSDNFVQICFDTANDTIKALKQRNREYQARGKARVSIPKMIGPRQKISEEMQQVLINAFYDPKIYKPLRDHCPRPVQP